MQQVSTSFSFTFLQRFGVYFFFKFVYIDIGSCPTALWRAPVHCVRTVTLGVTNVINAASSSTQSSWSIRDAKSAERHLSWKHRNTCSWTCQHWSHYSPSTCPRRMRKGSGQPIRNRLRVLGCETDWNRDALQGTCNGEPRCRSKATRKRYVNSKTGLYCFLSEQRKYCGLCNRCFTCGTTHRLATFPSQPTTRTNGANGGRTRSRCASVTSHNMYFAWSNFLVVLS